jgi:NAD(P)-dependent dehydrogenase (short-subunit alcohol dehydrogenase family)
MDSGINGRIIVITGASSGIGAEVARRAAALGGRPVLAARRETQLRAVAATCGAGAPVIVADVSRREEVERVVRQAIEQCGRIDVWINNAGRGLTRSIFEVTDEDFDEMMRVNVLSALYGMQSVMPHFRERGTGHIINVSSMLGRIPMAPMRSVYCAAKHALNALTAIARMELRQTHPGIHVSNVSPGVVATDFGISALGGGPDSRSLPNAQPVEEVAEVIVDLIRHPQADVYTRPGMKEMAAGYFAAEDMAEFESRLPVLPRPR